MTPYYEEDGIAIYHGDCREFGTLHWLGDVMVTDPPYGIDYQSGKFSSLPRGIVGDESTELRDRALWMWNLETRIRPALVFGTWRRPRPDDTRMVLVWDTKGALGMGDLALPWKPSHQEVYVIGTGFTGRRDSDVLRFAPVQSMAANGRVHPHEKPVDLMTALLLKCPAEWVVVDPFMGSGSTLVAAKQLGRRAVGIEIDERYCEVAVKRLAQGVLPIRPIREGGDDDGA